MLGVELIGAALGRLESVALSVSLKLSVLLKKLLSSVSEKVCVSIGKLH